MTTTLWDTTGSEVVKALAAERRAGGAVASGLALSLVVVVDERSVPQAEAAATTAAEAHPCRLLIVVRRQADAAEPRLDAEVQVAGRLGPGEAVVLRMYGRLGLHAESVVLPLLAPDAPVVTWWHGPPPERIAQDPLGVLADRRITDSVRASDPLAALQARAVDYAPGDTDLAWPRITLWRGLLASAFESVATPVRSVRIASEAGNPSAALLAGWLRARLGVQVDLDVSPGPGVTGLVVALEDVAEPLTLSRPGGRLATLHLPGQPDRMLPLARRELGELLAEELRRLDADEVYGEALGAYAGLTGLSGRPPIREHVWIDPALAAAP